MIEAYYLEVQHYLIKNLQPGKEDELFGKWHKYTAEH
jgi:hypothetical protein